jgi:hypothetical protein
VKVHTRTHILWRARYFLIFILKESGITEPSQQFRYLILLGLLKLACIFVAGPLFDTRGRRPLLLGSCAGMALALIILAMHMSSMPMEAKEAGGDPCAPHLPAHSAHTGSHASGGESTPDGDTSSCAWTPLCCVFLYLS